MLLTGKLQLLLTTLPNLFKPYCEKVGHLSFYFSHFHKNTYEDARHCASAGQSLTDGTFKKSTNHIWAFRRDKSISNTLVSSVLCPKPSQDSETSTM